MGMPRFGEYESVREVYQGGLAVVYTARAPGSSEEKIALKVLQLPVYLADEERVEQESVLFLEATETQRRAAAGGAWAPIHASGRCEGGAWYATDLFERSAEKLVLHRRELEPAELYRVIEAVVRGLLTLREIERRPHGNLKSTNILVSGRGDVSSARITLADPIPTSRIKPDEDSTKDLKDLGDLLHQLVMHRPMRNVMAWPLQLTTEWQRLGRVGAGWLELCNALLNPTGTPPSLDEVAGFLPELTAKPTGGSSAMVAGATPQAGAAPPTPRQPSGRAPSATPPPPTSRQDLSRSRPASSPGMEVTVAQPSGVDAPPGSSPGSAPHSDPALKSGSAGAAPIMPGSHPPSGPAPAPRPGLGKWKEPGAAVPAGDKPAEKKSKAPILIGAGVAVVVVGVAGWMLTRPDPEKEKGKGGSSALTDPVVTPPLTKFNEPDPRDGPMRRVTEDAIEKAAGILALVRQTNPNDKFPALESKLEAFRSELKALEAAEWNEKNRDSVLAAKAKLIADAEPLRREADEAGKKSDDPRLAACRRADAVIAGVRTLAAVMPQASPAREKLEQGLKDIEERYRATDPTKNTSKDKNSALDYANALDQLTERVGSELDRAFVAMKDPRDPEQIKKVEAKLGETTRTAAALDAQAASTTGTDPAALAALKKDIAALNEDATKVKAMVASLDGATVKWSIETIAPITKAVTEVESAANAAHAKALALWTRHASDPRPKARDAAGLEKTALDALETKVKAVLGSVSKAPNLSAADRTRFTGELEGAIKSVADAKETLNAALAASVKPEWNVDGAPEAGQKAVVITQAVTNARVSSAAINENLKKYQEYMAAAIEAQRKVLIAQAAEIVKGLEAGLSPSDDLGGATLEARFTQLKKDPEFEAVKNDAAIKTAELRLARLAKIAASSDAAELLGELKSAASGGQMPEGIQALLRLGRADQRVFPANAKELSDLAGAISALRQLAAGLADAPRAQRLTGVMTDTARFLWISYMARLDFTDEPSTKAALDLMPTLGLKAADLDRLGGRERFNLALRGFKAEIAGADEAKVRDAFTLFRGVVGAIPLDPGDQKSVESAVKAIEGIIDESAPKAAPPPNFSDLGPGKAGWAAREGKEHGIDTVTYSKSGQEIIFARVTETTFVSTTEVSLGLFMSVMDEGGRWKEVKQGNLLRLRPPWPGPRPWRWKVGGDQIELVEPDARDQAQNPQSKGWLDADVQKTEAVYPPAVAAGVAPPSLLSPMQNISPAGACFMARLLECRLPTSDEWAEALRKETGIGGAPKANLRDATWDMARKFVIEQQQIEKREPRYPDADFVAPATLQIPSRQSAEPAVSDNDGVMWFTPVNEGGGTLFRHLVGNVSEFVHDRPEDLAGIGPSIGEITAKLGTNQPQTLGVIGASAISAKHPDLAPEKKVATPRLSATIPANFARCDIGFRLAFTAGPPKPTPMQDLVRAAAAKVEFLARR